MSMEVVFFFFPASPIREELPLLSPQTNDATNTSSKNQEKGIQVADTKSNKRAVKQKKKKEALGRKGKKRYHIYDTSYYWLGTSLQTYNKQAYMYLDKSLEQC